MLFLMISQPSVQKNVKITWNFRYLFLCHLLSGKVFTGMYVYSFRILFPEISGRSLLKWMFLPECSINFCITAPMPEKETFSSILITQPNGPLPLYIAKKTAMTAWILYSKNFWQFFCTGSPNPTGRANTFALYAKNFHPWRRITAITFSSTVWKTRKKPILTKKSTIL